MTPTNVARVDIKKKKKSYAFSYSSPTQPKVIIMNIHQCASFCTIMLGARVGSLPQLYQELYQGLYQERYQELYQGISDYDKN